MTQHRDEPPTAQGPAADAISSPDDGPGATPPESETFTIAGPGSDPAAPAVQPAHETLVQPAGSDPVASAADPVGETPTPSTIGSSRVGLPAAAPSADYDKYGVPTLDFVRDKIEARYAASLGAEELARQTEEAKSFEQRAEERAKAAEAALDEIRKSLRDHRQS